MIISVANEKGGSGKTTIAVNLAVKFAHEDLDVLLVDADPQLNASMFSDLRTNENIVPEITTIAKTGPSLDKDVKKLAKKYDVVVIDTGGRDSVEMRKTFLISDYIIIPSVASQLDVWALDKMMKLYEDASSFNDKLKVFLLMSKISTNVFMNEGNELRKYLEELNEDSVQLLDTVIYERVDYRKAVREGKGVIEFSPESKATTEVNNLYLELDKLV